MNDIKITIEVQEGLLSSTGKTIMTVQIEGANDFQKNTTLSIVEDFCSKLAVDVEELDFQELKEGGSDNVSMER